DVARRLPGRRPGCCRRPRIRRFGLACSIRARTVLDRKVSFSKRNARPPATHLRGRKAVGAHRRGPPERKFRMMLRYSFGWCVVGFAVAACGVGKPADVGNNSNHEHGADAGNGGGAGGATSATGGHSNSTGGDTQGSGGATHGAGGATHGSGGSMPGTG